METNQDFRMFLQENLLARCRGNRSYSLRAFARSMQVSSSALSELLNGTRPITPRMRERLGLKLGLIPNQLEKYALNGSGTRRKSKIKYKKITSDVFELISSWQHYAILQLMNIKGFKWDSKWISRTLDLTVSEVNFSIQRLERVGILKKDKKGKLFDTTSGNTTDIGPELTSLAQRRHQSAALIKANENLETVRISRRDNTSMILAIDVKDIPYAKKRIAEFRRNLSQELESSNNPNSVYQLAISLTPLTKDIP